MGLEAGEVRTFAAYLVCGIVGALLLYVLPLGTADAFVCGNDIAHHMGSARAFVETGNWSMLEVTTNPDEAGAFYPAAHSLLAALVLGFMDVPVTLALNAVNTVVVGFMLPLGVWAVLTRVFGFRDYRAYAGAACCMLFAAFPWEFFTRPVLLYPTALGLALVPSFMALLMDCFPLVRRSDAGVDEVSSGADTSDAAGEAVSGVADEAVSGAAGEAVTGVSGKAVTGASPAAFSLFPVRILMALVGLAAIAFAHPSAFFSAVVFIMGYIACVLARRTAGRAMGRRILVVGAWIVVCVVAWIAVGQLPFLEDVVTYSYDARGGVVSGVARILVLWSPHIGVQYALGFVVLVGAVACLIDRRRRWLLVPYLIAAVLVCANLVLPAGPLKSLFSGFWYNHPPRLMATLMLYAIPLAAQGAGAIACVLSRIAHAAVGGKGAKAPDGAVPVAGSSDANASACVAPATDGSDTKTPSRMRIASMRLESLRIGWVGGIVAAAIVVVVAFVPLPLPRSVTLLSYAESMADFNDPNSKTSFLTSEEREFLLLVSEEVDGGGVVLNNPNDGSAFAYGLYGIDVMTRSFYGSEGGEKSLLAKSIDKIASDRQVAEAAIDLGAGYVLQLDCDGSGTIYQNRYDPAEWAGIFAVHEDTPGLELVLSEGDMRLYRIVI